MRRWRCWQRKLDAHAHAHADTNAYADSHADSHADTNADTDTDTDTNPHPHSDTNADADASAHIGSRYARWSKRLERSSHGKRGVVDDGRRQHRNGEPNQRCHQL
jgi:hypothetical protein